MKLTASDIHVELGGNEILKGIDAAIKEKEFVGIIGPNGSGKSTLLKCIYRVLKPDTGVIMLDGKPLSEYKVKDSAKALAVVSQHNYYNFEFSVQEIVMMGRAPHKKTMERDNAEDYKIVEECLEKVGMLPYRHRVFSSLSGGEQQRIILARALAQKTDCLILDEPTRGIDIGTKTEIQKLVLKLADEGKSLIFISSEIEEMLRTCNRMAVLRDGQKVGEIDEADMNQMNVMKAIAGGEQ